MAWSRGVSGGVEAQQAYDEAFALDPGILEGHLHEGRLTAVRSNVKAAKGFVPGA